MGEEGSNSYPCQNFRKILSWLHKSGGFFGIRWGVFFILKKSSWRSYKSHASKLCKDRQIFFNGYWSYVWKTNQKILNFVNFFVCGTFRARTERMGAAYHRPSRYWQNCSFFFEKVRFEFEYLRSRWLWGQPEKMWDAVLCTQPDEFLELENLIDSDFLDLKNLEILAFWEKLIELER